MAERGTPIEGAMNVVWAWFDDTSPYVVDAVLSDLKERFDRDWTPNGYGEVPLCGPARVGHLTGRYPHNHDAIHNETSWRIYQNRGYAPRDLFSRMWQAGYRTGFFGKVINGYGEAPAWEHPYVDRWVALADGQGQKLPYQVNVDGDLKYTDESQTTYFADRAIGFVRSGAAESRPWLCYLSMTDGHVPHDPLKAFINTHNHERWTSPGTQESNLSDKSSWSRERAATGGDGPADWQNNWEGTLEELEGAKRRLHQLLNALEETGQAENTLIILSADNGYMHGEHGGLYRKGLPYEESARVPYLVRIPGVDLPSDLLVSRLDATATILDVAGSNMSDLDGRSFYRWPSTWRKRLLVEHPGVGWRMLREGSYVYMRLPSGEEELYDLSVDPYQNESLSYDAWEAQYLDLRAKCSAMAQASGDELRALEEA